MERYRDAFYAPMITDWRNYENWRDAGEKTATQRATEIWKKLLDSFQPPVLDQAIAEEIEAFVAKRKEQITHSNKVA